MTSNKKDSLSNKMLREEIINIKRKLVVEEKKNSRYLFFYCAPSGKGWYMAGGNTALFFLQFYAKRIGYEGDLRKDDDNFARFGLGTLRFPDFESKYLPKLQELPDLTKLPPKSPFVYAFKMNKAVTEAEIVRLRNSTQTMIRSLNEYLSPPIKQPVAWTQLRLASKSIIEIVSGMRQPLREIHGIEAGRTVFNIYTNWLQAASGDPKAVNAYYAQTIQDIDWLLRWLHFAANMRNITSLNTIARTAEQLCIVKKAMNEALKDK